MTALVALGALVGLMIGSFLNVVIVRVPLRRSVAISRSCCPQCGVEIAARDNVPVLSWCLLRGRCRHCRAPISLRYPIVEIATAIAFASVVARYGKSAELAPFLVVVSGLIALSGVDLERRLLPVRILYPTLLLAGSLFVVVAALTDEWMRLVTALACAMALGALLLVVHLSAPGAMGFGDVRLALLIGGSLGWIGVPEVLIGFLAANVLGLAIAVILMATRRWSRQTPLPYGLFLSLGTFASLVLGQPIAARLIVR